MEALDALLNRVSVPRLVEPAPDAAQREMLFRAALRAPDHGQLRPWRFLTVEGQARERMGELFAEALLVADAQAAPEALNKARAHPQWSSLNPHAKLNQAERQEQIDLLAADL